MPSMVMNSWIEAMFKIAPPSARRSAGMACLARRQVPVRATANTPSHFASVIVVGVSAGVVDQSVEPPEPHDHIGSAGRGRRLVGDVAGHEQQRPFGERVGQSDAAPGVGVEHRQLGVVGVDPPDGSPPDALSAHGDDRHLGGELHRPLLGV